MTDQCPDCLGTGKVYSGEVAHWCDCPIGQAARKESLLSASGVPRARLGETFASFQALPGTEKALAAAKQFVAGKFLWLLICGAVGSGKSHLAYAITIAYVEQGKRARVANAEILLSELRAVSGGPALSQALAELGALPILVLDDLFWSTDLEGRWLEEIVQRRYMGKRPLVATTSLDVKQLPENIVSRFHELGKIVLNKGKDYRR
jgi:DNA replication protein DnaC